MEYEKSCEFISNKTPPSDHLIYYEQYKMITSVRKPDNSREKPILEEQCGSQNVAPWGNLYPVFSKVKNRLYKNIACATLDGSLNVIPFDVFFICDRYDAHRMDLNNIIGRGWISNSLRNICRLEFKYPGNTNDLQRHKCSNELMIPCPAHFSFKTVENTTYQAEKIFTCDPELQSSSSAVMQMYGNVFCHVCKEKEFGEDLICSDDDKNRRSSSTYNILIDMNFISELNKNDLKKKEAPLACSVTNVRISYNIIHRTLWAYLL